MPLRLLATAFALVSLFAGARPAVASGIGSCVKGELSAGPQRVQIRDYPVENWMEDGIPKFRKDIYIQGASKASVLHALWNVDPHGVSIMEILDLPSPQAPRVRNYFLKAPNPMHGVLSRFGLPRFLAGPDPLQLLGSKIEMSLTDRGFIMDISGPIANGRSTFEVLEGNGYLVVRETGSLGGKIQNFGHNTVFDLTLELERLLNAGPRR